MRSRLPGDSDGKESAFNAGDSGSVPGLGISPGEGNGNPLQYSCLENSWTEEPGRLQAMGSEELDMTERLTLQAFQNHNRFSSHMYNNK